MKGTVNRKAAAAAAFPSQLVHYSRKCRQDCTTAEQTSRACSYDKKRPGQQHYACSCTKKRHPLLKKQSLPGRIRSAIHVVILIPGYGAISAKITVSKVTNARDDVEFLTDSLVHSCGDDTYTGKSISHRMDPHLCHQQRE